MAVFGIVEMEENSHEENEAIIISYCDKNGVDPSSHKQVVSLTASLIKMGGELLEDTVFNRIDSDGEWLPEVKKRWETGSKSKEGQGVKGKKKKPEKEGEKEKEKDKEEEDQKKQKEQDRESGKEQGDRKNKEKKEKKSKKEKKDRKGGKEGEENNPSLSSSQASSDDDKH